MNSHLFLARVPIKIQRLCEELDVTLQTHRLEVNCLQGGSHNKIPLATNVYTYENVETHKFRDKPVKGLGLKK